MQSAISVLDRANGSLSLVAIRKEPISLAIYDFRTNKWDELGRINAGFPNWSRDGQYVYCLRMDDREVVRFRVSGHRMETVADLRNLPLTGLQGLWLGLGLHDEPILLRDVGRQDVYAVDLER